MNAAELGRNGVLSDFVVADLNAEPKLPYPDNTFDVVTNAVSVDYLTRPLEVMKEVQRVLKPVRMRRSMQHSCIVRAVLWCWADVRGYVCECVCGRRVGLR
jgi:ubiquinone/menaquinone biosynthesis C-methylase UbiE